MKVDDEVAKFDESDIFETPTLISSVEAVPVELLVALVPELMARRRGERGERSGSGESGANSGLNTRRIRTRTRRSLVVAGASNEWLFASSSSST